MFGSKPIVSEDIKDWILASFDWLGSRFVLPDRPILPTKEFFTAPGGQDHNTAVLVLNDVLRLMCFERSVNLEPLDKIPVEYRHEYGKTSDIAGTFQQSGDDILICYDPELLGRPLQFNNTMAHEVMHARLAGVEHELPGGLEAHEFATDLGCIAAGFGVFQLQAADDAGWSGYLSQNSRAFALAAFLARRGLDADAANAHLSSRCQKLLKKGMTEVG